MAHHVEARLNWDAVEEEFDEDADDLNYDYEWVVPEQGSSIVIDHDYFLHPVSCVHDMLFFPW